MDVPGLGRLLIILGVVLLVAGVLLVFGSKIPLVGSLPGDLVFRKNGLTVFAPLATMLLLSLALTILVNLFLRLFR